MQWACLFLVHPESGTGSHFHHLHLNEVEDHHTLVVVVRIDTVAAFLHRLAVHSIPAAGN